MNTLTPEIHREAGFEELINAVERKMGGEGSTKSDRVIIDKIADGKISTTSSDVTQATELTVESPAVIRPVNLSFDQPMIGNQPSGWFNSFGFVNGVSIDYESKIVSRPSGGKGLCVLFQNLKATDEEFGSLMQRCSADYLAGKVIRFEGEVKTKDVEKWAGLWLRADSVDNSVLFFDNMNQRQIRGSTSWTEYTIDAQLPKETGWLNYGILLAGRGSMWADNFQLKVWDEGKWVDV